MDKGTNVSIRVPLKSGGSIGLSAEGVQAGEDHAFIFGLVESMERYANTPPARDEVAPPYLNATRPAPAP